MVDMRTHVMSVPPQEVPTPISAHQLSTMCCAAHDCFTRLVISRQEHAIDALRACYIHQDSTESGLLYARSTFGLHTRRRTALHATVIMRLMKHTNCIKGQGVAFKRVLLYKYHALPR